MKIHYYLLTILVTYSHSIHAQQSQKPDRHRNMIAPVIIGSTCIVSVLAIAGIIWFMKNRHAKKYRYNNHDDSSQAKKIKSHLSNKDELEEVAHIYIMHPAQSPDIATVHSLDCSPDIYSNTQPPIQWDNSNQRRYVDNLCHQQQPVAILCNVNKNVLEIVEYDPCPANTWNRQESDKIAKKAAKKAGWQIL